MHHRRRARIRSKQCRRNTAGTRGPPAGFASERPTESGDEAASRFDAEGNLTDEGTRTLIAELLAALRDWTLRLRG